MYLVLLDKEDTDKLRLLLEKEKEKYYVSCARKALTAYLNGYNPGFYDYTEDKRLIICKNSSAYLLNTDEILTPKRKKELESRYKVKWFRETIIGESAIKIFEENPSKKVGTIDTSEYSKNEYLIQSEDKSTSYLFYKSVFDYCEKFLGEESEYKISETKPALLATSKKGKALLLGLKNSIK